jgi:two-component system cell cycle response regulator DivK
MAAGRVRREELRRVQESNARATSPSGKARRALRCVRGLLYITTFIFRVRHPLDEAPRAEEPVIQIRRHSGMADSSKTVLLVEDNEDNRTVYRTILEHFGYQVIEARNGEDGIRMAREDHPDLILMDISIPLIDGWEATKILKADPATSTIPIIALTAHALATDRAKAQEVGCDGYLAKPCEPRRVVAEVEKFIGSGREVQA